MTLGTQESNGSSVNTVGAKRPRGGRSRGKTLAKDVLTTGQVARICNVTIRTVIKWFECGKLEGYKIPASKDRRIPREALRAFVRDHKIHHDPALLDIRPRLLILDDDAVLGNVLKDAFERSRFFEVFVANNDYEAGFLTARHSPDVLLIDYELGKNITAPQVLETLRRDDRLRATRVIIMSGVLDREQVEFMRANGQYVVTKPFDVDWLEAEIRRMLKV